MKSGSASRVDQSGQRWFGHMERMNVQHVAWKMMMMMQARGEYNIIRDVVE